MERARPAARPKKSFRFDCTRTFTAYLPKDGMQVWGKLGPDAACATFYSAMIFENVDDAGYYDAHGHVRPCDVTLCWSIPKRTNERDASAMINGLEGHGIAVRAWVVQEGQEDQEFVRPGRKKRVRRKKAEQVPV